MREQDVYDQERQLDAFEKHDDEGHHPQYVQTQVNLEAQLENDHEGPAEAAQDRDDSPEREERRENCIVGDEDRGAHPDELPESVSPPADQAAAHHAVGHDVATPDAQEIHDAHEVHGGPEFGVHLVINDCWALWRHVAHGRQGTEERVRCHPVAEVAEDLHEDRHGRRAALEVRLREELHEGLRVVRPGLRVPRDLQRQPVYRVDADEEDLVDEPDERERHEVVYPAREVRGLLEVPDLAGVEVDVAGVPIS
mmetsp:Transcript_55619/g.156567  ORF Transcript_55619/g.156567 Transcript_55619/m.156567 type:complete len:253 (+) Transcript_55619:292-1050(+)